MTVHGNMAKEKTKKKVTTKSYTVSEQNLRILLEKYSEMFKYLYQDDPSIANLALSIHGYYIKEIDNPTLEQQKIAVKRDATSISHSKNPFEEVQMMAVLNDADNIRRIKNPTDKVQLVAINNDNTIFMYLKTPSLEVSEIFNKYLSKLIKIKNEDEVNCYYIDSALSRVKGIRSSTLILFERIVNDNKTKERIKKHKNYKNDAQLILEKFDQK
jgi:hypothetical protein